MNRVRADVVERLGKPSEITTEGAPGAIVCQLHAACFCRGPEAIEHDLNDVRDEHVLPDGRPRLCVACDQVPQVPACVDELGEARTCDGIDVMLDGRSEAQNHTDAVLDGVRVRLQWGRLSVHAPLGCDSSG
jgi:hypothetical protein